MFQALKLVRSPQNLILSSPLSSFSRRATALSFTQAKCSSSKPESEKKMSNTPKEGDVMSHSFGEGYSTRSEEEGFGGTFGSNQTLNKKEDDNTVHENHPDYDKSQGSDVKEKEMARNQTHQTNTP